MIDNQILRSSLRREAADVLYLLEGMADLYSVYDGRSFAALHQIRVVAHARRQRPKAFKFLRCAVVYSYIIYLIGNYFAYFHCALVLFRRVEKVK